MPRPGSPIAARLAAMVITETEIKTVDGEHVCTGYGTLVERGSG